MAGIVKITFGICFVILVLEVSMIWEGKRPAGKLFAGILGAFYILIFDGFLLSLIGKCALPFLICVFVFEDFMIGAYLLRAKKTDLHWIKGIRVNPLVISMSLIAMLLLWGFPSMDIYGGRDEGLYFTQGIHIAKTGSLFYEEEDPFLEQNYEKISGWCELGYMGLYSKYNYGTSADYGAYEFQFFPLFPAALAIGYLLGGIPLLIRINGLIGLLSLLSIYCYVRDFLGNRIHALTGCYCLLFSPAFLWNVRGTFSETLAQCLFFSSVYLFAKGWEEEKNGYAILAGSMTGLALLTRIDVLVWGIGIFAAAIWILFFERKKEKYASCFVRTYLMCLLFVSAYAVVCNYSYLYEHWHFLKLLLFAHIMLLVIWAMMRHFKIGDFENFLTNKKVQNGFVVVFWLVMIFLSIIRIRLEGENAATRAVIEFAWYTSFIALFGAPIGIKRILNRNKEKQNRCMFFLFTAGGMFLLYIVNPNVSSDHIWASRRWILSGIPFILICFANMFHFGNLRIRNWMNGMLIMAVIGYLAYQDRGFMTVRIFDGTDRQYEMLANKLDDDGIYYTSSTWLASTLRFVYDKNVYFIDKGHLMKNGRTENVEEELAVYLQKEGRGIYYIGSDNMTDARLHFTVIEEYTINGEDLERTIGSFPEKLQHTEIRANIYEVTVDG